MGPTWPDVLASRGFVLLLVLLWAGAYLPNLGGRGMRLEEGRRAAPARTMLASGDFALPRLYGEPYLSKPPLFFWLAAATTRLRGGPVDELSVRLPSVLATLVGALLLLYGFAESVPPIARAVAALAFLSGPVMLDKGSLGEIEAFFCLLIYTAWAVWWSGYQRMLDQADDPAMPIALPAETWLWVGVILGLAMLTKGPPALALFYVPILAFLGLEGRLRLLRHWAHGVAILLAGAPLAVWVVTVLGSAGVEPVEALAWWQKQMGADGSAPRDGWHRLYRFPLAVAVMLLPTGLVSVGMAWPRLARQLGVPDGLRRYLLTLVLATFIFFWLWPNSRARHMMAVWYPTCLLAGLVTAYLPRMGPIGHWPELALFGGRLAAGVTALAGLVAVVLTSIWLPTGLPTAGVAAVLLMVLGICSWCWMNRTPRELTLPALAAATSVAILSGWTAGATLFFWPLRASQDGCRQLHAALADRLDPSRPIRTLLNFPIRGEGHYNRQFYLGDRLLALHQLSDLPLGQPTTVIMQESDRAEAEAIGGYRLVLLTVDPDTSSQPDPVLAVEVTRLLPIPRQPPTR